MSTMSEIALEVELMLAQETHPSTISAVLGVPVAWVYQIIEDCQEDDEFDFDPFENYSPEV